MWGWSCHQIHKLLNINLMDHQYLHDESNNNKIILFKAKMHQIHSSPKEMNIAFIQFSRWLWVTDPDLRSCRFCITAKTIWQNQYDPRHDQENWMKSMCPSFGEECTSLKKSFLSNRNIYYYKRKFKGTSTRKHCIPYQSPKSMK